MHVTTEPREAALEGSVPLPVRAYRRQRRGTNRGG